MEEGFKGAARCVGVVASRATRRRLIRGYWVLSDHVQRLAHTLSQPTACCNEASPGTSLKLSKLTCVKFGMSLFSECMQRVTETKKNLGVRFEVRSDKRQGRRARKDNHNVEGKGSVHEPACVMRSKGIRARQVASTRLG